MGGVVIIFYMYGMCGMHDRYDRYGMYGMYGIIEMHGRYLNTCSVVRAHR